jgi:trk system potassium uptake protein TrkA
MRIIISGDGEIAYQLARTLYEQHDLVIIEDNPDEAARFDRLDVQMLHGNASHPDVLREAGIEAADNFIACLGSDELNIISCLTAKRIAPTRTTCFVSREEYVRSFAGIVESDGALAIDRIIWPQYMLAEEIARIVLVPRAIDVEIFAGGRIWLMEFRLRDDSPLLGALVDSGLPRGVLAVAVRRADDLFIPSGRTILKPGDRVAFMGNQGALRGLQERVNLADRNRSRRRQVVIVGGGTVGLALAKRLERERDVEIKVIETDRERCEELAAELPRSLVLRGDGTDLELLEAEQVGRSEVLVSVTSNDEKNLLCSLLAKQMQVPKIITRVNRRENVRLFEGVGIDVPLNPMTTAINVVLNSLQENRIQLLASIESGKAAVMELDVPENYEGLHLRELPRIEGAIIVAITRGEETLVPGGADRIEPGDRLLVFATESARADIRKLF